METLTFDISSWEWLIGALATIGYALYKYSQKNGLKIVSAETIATFKADYEFLEDLRKHISEKEWNAIIEQGKLLKNKKSRTQAEMLKYGLLVMNAIITDEKEESEK